MSARAVPSTPRARARLRLKRLDGVADGALRGLCLLAALLAGALILDIGYQLIHGARPAIARFGLGFLGHEAWKPNFNVFGAKVMLVGTAVTSAMALLIATPIGISIGLFLSMFSPRAV